MGNEISTNAPSPRRSNKKHRIIEHNTNKINTEDSALYETCTNINKSRTCKQERIATFQKNIVTAKGEVSDMSKNSIGKIKEIDDLRYKLLLKKTNILNIAKKTIQSYTCLVLETNY